MFHRDDMADVYMCCDTPSARPGMKFCGSCGTKMEDYMISSHKSTIEITVSSLDS